LDRLRKLYHAHKDRANFVFVYITEGPHRGLLPIPKNLGKKGVRRITEAGAARTRYGIKYFHLPFPCLLDSADHKVEKAFGAFPERLVIVDTRRRIALDEGIGMNGFTWNYKRIETCLKKYPRSAVRLSSVRMSTQMGPADHATLPVVLLGLLCRYSDAAIRFKT